MCIIITGTIDSDKSYIQLGTNSYSMVVILLFHVYYYQGTVKTIDSDKSYVQIVYNHPMMVNITVHVYYYRGTVKIINSDN